MLKIILICLFSLVSLITFARTDRGYGHTGVRWEARQKRLEKLRQQRIEKSINRSRDEYKKDSAEETVDDSEYTEQYKRSLLTQEERDFAEDNGISIDETERIREEYKKHQQNESEKIQKLRMKNSIQRIELSEEESVAWKFISDNRESEYNNKELVVKYFIPKGEEKVTATNILYGFYNADMESFCYTIQGKDNINDFSNNISKIVSKMEQWINVAKKNKVNDFEKDFDGVSFPVKLNNDRELTLKAKFKVFEKDDEINYSTSLFYSEEDSIVELISFDIIGFKNFVRASQLDKALPFLRKKIEEINDVDGLFK